MPTASSFKFLGFGNGLPFSEANLNFRSINVNDYDHYVVMSFDEMIQIFWNLYGLKCEVIGSSDTTTNQVDDVNDSANDNFEPVDKADNFSLGSRESVVNTQGTNGIDNASLTMFTNGFFRKMYNGTPQAGDTNLLGYGFEKIAQMDAHKSSSSPVLNYGRTITFGSYFNEGTSSGNTTYSYSQQSPSGTSANFIVEQIDVVTGTNPPPPSIGTLELEFWTY